jgi:DnaJ-class molecular chaperone
MHFVIVPVAQCPVELRDAMLGVSTSVRTLDDRVLRIEARHVTPDTVKLFPGEGMPNSKVCTYCICTLHLIIKSITMTALIDHLPV